MAIDLHGDRTGEDVRRARDPQEAASRTRPTTVAGHRRETYLERLLCLSQGLIAQGLIAQGLVAQGLVAQGLVALLCDAACERHGSENGDRPADLHEKLHASAFPARPSSSFIFGPVCGEVFLVCEECAFFALDVVCHMLSPFMLPVFVDSAAWLW
ncbi:hypothetical protein ACMHYB_06140 [Sorangium sp. So ce1128]